ncbi:MAG: O-antigen ligase family protein [Candidatus Omnitrophica bacterium]|nr:O-antigen ligase family protein [Candidatus Omnitrophota bacterium]
MKNLSFRLLWLFIFTIPWENTVTFGAATISHIMGIAALCVCLLSVLLRRGKIHIPSLGLLLTGALFSWIFASVFWSIDPVITLKRNWTYLELLGMVWLIWEVARTEKEQESLIRAFLYGSFISVVNTIIDYAGGGHAYNLQRFVASGFDPNDAAVVMAIGITMAWYLSLLARRGYAALLYRAYIPLALFAILLTGSRGGFITAMVSLSVIVLFFTRTKFWQYIFFVVTAGVFGYFVAGFIPGASLQRISSMSSDISSAIGIRKEIWLAGLQAFQAEPVWGVGAGCFAIAIIPFLGISIVSHNTFLSILVEFGIIGFMLFFILMLYLVLNVKRMQILQKKFWIAAFLTWATGVSALTWEYRKATWFLIALLITQIALNKKIKADNEKDQSTAHNT